MFVFSISILLGSCQKCLAFLSILKYMIKLENIIFAHPTHVAGITNQLQFSFPFELRYSLSIFLRITTFLVN